MNTFIAITLICALAIVKVNSMPQSEAVAAEKAMEAKRVDVVSADAVAPAVAPAALKSDTPEEPKKVDAVATLDIAKDQAEPVKRAEASAEPAKH